jgi:hypothetical protein
MIAVKGIPDDAEVLLPLRSGRTRLIVWLCFVAFLAIGRAPWTAKLISALLFGATIGVYPWTAISSRRITRGWTLFGWTLHSQDWRLTRFLSIDTGSESDDAIPDPTGMLTFLLFGMWSVFWPVFGWLFPWAGGPYRLSLRDLDDEHIIIWQGRRDQDFQENLQTLQKYLSLPIGRG